MSLPPLVPDGDPDLTGWQSGTQETFLAMVTREVRKYCGWHISPSMSVVGQRCRFGSKDLVMLKSTFVTSVDEVTVDGDVQVEGCDYFWDSPHAWFERRAHSWPRDHFASVDYTHGYEDTPEDVKAVIFEVMATAMELPASNASEVMTMQYRFNLNPDIGVALSDTQRRRLGHYKITSFGR